MLLAIQKQRMGWAAAGVPESRRLLEISREAGGQSSGRAPLAPDSKSGYRPVYGPARGSTGEPGCHLERVAFPIRRPRPRLTCHSRAPATMAGSSQPGTVTRPIFAASDGQFSGAQCTTFPAIASDSGPLHRLVRRAVVAHLRTKLVKVMPSAALSRRSARRIYGETFPQLARNHHR